MDQTKLNLVKQVKALKIKKQVDARLKQFKALNKKSSKEWFSELCFCLLTANWKAKESIEIQNELKYKGFSQHKQKQLQKYLKAKGHRFHPQRAERICLAREHLDIKNKLKGKKDYQAREWLVEHIKGIGYKEASHFLRNVGYDDLAIIDRHILKVLYENNYLKEIPKTITKKKYLEIENALAKLAKQLKMTQAELDLYLWYIKTKKILK